MNSRTSQGELRKVCVSAQQILRMFGDGEIWPRPSTTPAIVPTAIVRKLITMFRAKPFVTRKGNHRHRASRA